MLQYHLKTQLREDPLPKWWAVGPRAQVLSDYWLEDSLSFLPHKPLHHNMAAGFPQCECGRAIKTEIRVFLYPNFRSNIHQFCCILFIRSKSPGPIRNPSEGFTKGMNTVGQGLSGATIESTCYSKATWGSGGGNPLHFSIPSVSNYLQAYLKLTS